jgi:hypothetical protein
VGINDGSRKALGRKGQLQKKCNNNNNNNNNNNKNNREDFVSADSDGRF